MGGSDHSIYLIFNGNDKPKVDEVILERANKIYPNPSKVRDSLSFEDIVRWTVWQTVSEIRNDFNLTIKEIPNVKG